MMNKRNLALVAIAALLLLLLTVNHFQVGMTAYGVVINGRKVLGGTAYMNELRATDSTGLKLYNVSGGGGLHVLNSEDVTANATFSAASNITSAMIIYGVGVDAGDGDGTNFGNIALDSISSDAGTEVVVNEAGNDEDFRIEATGGITDALFVEGSSGFVGIGTTTPTATLQVSGTTTMGDNGINEMSVSSTGDVLWVGTGGLVFGEIYVVAASDTITITGSGQGNKVQIASFDTNGLSNNMVPDYTNAHVAVTNAGIYLCVVSLHIESAGGGGADTFGFSVYKNNGVTEFLNLHAHRQLAGGGGDVGSVSMSGIIDLAVNDTIELWTWNEDSNDDLVVQDVTLSLVQVGGT